MIFTNNLDELKAAKQWLNYIRLWNPDKHGGKGGYDKPPINPLTLRNGNSKDPETWTTYDQAAGNIGKTAKHRDGKHRNADGSAPTIEASIEGVGLVLSNGYCGIDLDNVLDDDGNLLSWAAVLVERLDTYTEISPSGRGLHCLLFCGDLLKAGQDFGKQFTLDIDGNITTEEKKHSELEVYFYVKGGRYFTVSGKPYRDRPLNKTKDAVLRAIYEEYCSKADNYKNSQRTRSAVGASTVTSNLVKNGDTRAMIDSALTVIDPAGLDFGEWAAVMTALKVIGYSLTDAEAWSSGSLCGIQNAKNISGNNFYRWDKFAFKNGDENAAGVIINLAKKYGWTPADAFDEVTRAEYGRNLYTKEERREYGRMKHKERLQEHNNKCCTPLTDNIVNTNVDQEETPQDEKLPLQIPEFSDVMQSTLLVQEYGTRLRYSKETGYLVYTGKKWELSELKAQKFSQRLTDRQLRDARSKLNKARGRLDKIEEAAARGETDPDFYNAKGEEKAAKEYRKQVVSRRNTARIKATLIEAAPKVEINIGDLDADRLLLNTPGGAVDLRSGEVRPNMPEDYCTKITGVSPSNNGSEIFETFLDQITCNDNDLKRYLQEVAGVFTTGVVMREELYIAVGSGGNGKSTFFNLLSMVMGDYAGQIASDVLVTNSQRNKYPEMAELRGKRLVLAAELDEGCRLDSSMVKKLASTDPVRAEPKYKDPFSFIPSHSLILYTNHLPKVGARDAGTWDRLVLIPFNARFRNASGEIKNYAEHLFRECGGYVLSWMIEGARLYISHDYTIEKPSVVRAAIAEYQNNNDWLQSFLDECCIAAKGERVFSGELYRAYREYCNTVGDYVRHNSEFNTALENAGFERRKTNNGKVFLGLRLKTPDETQRDIIAAEKFA